MKILLLLGAGLVVMRHTMGRNETVLNAGKRFILQYFFGPISSVNWNYLKYLHTLLNF